ncbi:hypothetical protein [Nodularia spumigena]|nr:hypothetical protein [Nodularia spumigena]MDB9322333.1 hypothetical protein [Nodularia spumigena CS-591/07A]MDB9330894.1 hypothetical protein [Nodularia spumigena CS-591/04]MDB9360199.1 hypothetical protein [Nodularia spumigena CS-588/02]MDB9366142.1 hypothetical protein [Nodularia spumigena CS-588/02A10]MEA5615889.1 hypothetical protein [Nodularia spumigena UHCC 0040]
MEISPSNNNPSNLLGDTKNSPSKGDRLRHSDPRYRLRRAEHRRLVKSSKYIAKR